MPEAVARQLTEVDTLGHRFTLPLSATMPEVGHTLIINTPTTALHDGLLAKVTGVTETGSGYVVTYEDASLQDAFKTFHIPESYLPLNSYVEHVYDASGKEVPFSRITTRVSGEEKTKIQIPEIGWSLGDGLELTPKMTLDFAMRYVMMYDDYQIDYANVKVDVGAEVGADLSFKLGEIKLVDYRQPLASVFFAAIPDRFGPDCRHCAA